MKTVTHLGRETYIFYQDSFPAIISLPNKQEAFTQDCFNC